MPCESVAPARAFLLVLLRTYAASCLPALLLPYSKGRKSSQELTFIVSAPFEHHKGMRQSQ